MTEKLDAGENGRTQEKKKSFPSFRWQSMSRYVRMGKDCHKCHISSDEVK
ncbi:hypothetical protein [Angelakisella massiliensis]|nr:hypothetical protein [Angelakisella massiliensis]